MSEITYSNLVGFNIDADRPAELYIGKTYYRMSHREVATNLQNHTGDLSGLIEADYEFKKRGFFVCVDCNRSFQSLDPPAETRVDDESPQCMDCIDKMLEAIDPIPLTKTDVDIIMVKAGFSKST